MQRHIYVHPSYGHRMSATSQGIVKFTNEMLGRLESDEHSILLAAGAEQGLNRFVPEERRFQTYSKLSNTKDKIFFTGYVPSWEWERYSKNIDNGGYMPHQDEDEFRVHGALLHDCVLMTVKQLFGLTYSGKHLYTTETSWNLINDVVNNGISVLKSASRGEFKKSRIRLGTVLYRPTPVGNFDKIIKMIFGAHNQDIIDQLTDEETEFINLES